MEFAEKLPTVDPELEESEEPSTPSGASSPRTLPTTDHLGGASGELGDGTQGGQQTETNLTKKSPGKHPILSSSRCVAGRRAKSVQKAGTFIRPRVFSFEPISWALQTGANHQQGQKSLKATEERTSAMPSRVKSASSRRPPCAPEDGIAQHESRLIFNTKATKKIGPAHRPSSRIDALLRKYLPTTAKDCPAPLETPASAASPEEEAGLQQPAPMMNVFKDTNNASHAHQACYAHASADVEGQSLSIAELDFGAIAARKAGLKPIMQAKSEQDAVIRSLQHAPRTLHAKPVPLAVAERRLDPQQKQGSCTPSSTAADEKMARNEVFIPRPVPISSSEPLYAMMKADSVLKKLSFPLPLTAEEQPQEIASVLIESSTSFVQSELLKRPSSARGHSIAVNNTRSDGIITSTLQMVVEGDE